MTSTLVSLILSGITVLPVDDAACAKAPKGWIRGVVRVTSEKPNSSDLNVAVAPKETVANVRRLRPTPIEFLNEDEGIVGHSAVDANGTFAITIEPKLRGRRLKLAIDVQMDWATERVVLTFDPAVFKGGMCLEVFLRTEKQP